MLDPVVSCTLVSLFVESFPRKSEKRFPSKLQTLASNSIGVKGNYSSNRNSLQVDNSNVWADASSVTDFFAQNNIFLDGLGVI